MTLDLLPVVAPLLRCTRCFHEELSPSDQGFSCCGCGHEYGFRDGILDMIGEEPAGVITPFQRVMQTSLVVSIYERFWRRIGYFIASSRSFSAEIETVLEMGRGQRGAAMLDIACGPGVFTRPLSRQFPGAVLGLDLSWPMLRYARSRAVLEGLENVLFIRGTVLRLPFRCDSFSYVNCCGALHLFDRPVAAMEEISRILGPSGNLSVQTTIRPERSAGLAYLLERYIRFGFFDQATLHLELERRRLRILRSERHRISYTFLAQRD